MFTLAKCYGIPNLSLLNDKDETILDDRYIGKVCW